MQRTNVYAGVKGQILKGFSNVPKILQAYPMAEAVLGARCPSSRYEYRAPIQRLKLPDMRQDKTAGLR